MKKIYIKSNNGYDNIYKPKSKTVNICLGNIIRKIENDDKISNELKGDFIDAYNNIPNKTRIQFHNKYYREYNNNNNNMWLFKHNLKEVIDVTPYTLLCFKSGIYSREMSGCSKRCG